MTLPPAYAKSINSSFALGFPLDGSNYNYGVSSKEINVLRCLAKFEITLNVYERSDEF